MKNYILKSILLITLINTGFANTQETIDIKCDAKLSFGSVTYSGLYTF